MTSPAEAGKAIAAVALAIARTRPVNSIPAMSLQQFADAELKINLAPVPGTDMACLDIAVDIHSIATFRIFDGDRIEVLEFNVRAVAAYLPRIQAAARRLCPEVAVPNLEPDPVPKKDDAPRRDLN